MSHFSHQLKKLRLEKNYSMQQLADLAQVSKSMISKIERDEVQPTLDIATRLAQAFGKTLSSMLETYPESLLVKIAKGEHSVWEDPIVHSFRKVLSPPFPEGKLEWLEVTFPANSKTSLGPLKKGSEKYLLVVEGTIEIMVDDQSFSLSAGDSGYFAAHFPHSFINSSTSKTVYYLIIKHS